ncbi:MAG: hypothetical protein Q9183_004307 [Haloplaca sp. 2 TL-2023]
MAATRKYAALLDLDDAAPDIYETPELTDDASTVPQGKGALTEPRVRGHTMIILSEMQMVIQTMRTKRVWKESLRDYVEKLPR